MNNKSQEDYIKEIAEKINNSKVEYIENRPFTIQDIENIEEYHILRQLHKKGFYISVKKQHKLFTVLNIPVLGFTDNYVVSDELMGEHPLELNQEEVVEYLNGLLGYE